MEGKIVEMIKKHPVPSFLLFIALTVPYSIELYLTNWRELISIGLIMIIGTSFIFSSIAICLWGVVYLITGSLINKMTKENTWIVSNWDIGIKGASFAFIGWSLFCVAVCHFLSLGFKWFVFLTYIIPFLRIIISSVQYIYFKKRHEHN